MAHSPSPIATAFAPPTALSHHPRSTSPPAHTVVASAVAHNHHHHHHHHHAHHTPPQPATVSKRDKRRSAIDQRLRELTQSFAANREGQLRSQLNALSRDIYFIGSADPYRLQPLDDAADDLVLDVGGGGSVSARGAAGGEGEVRLTLGKWASGFVEEINNAMELRDVGLAEVDMRFHSTIEALRVDYEFALECAEAESESLKKTVLERSISAIRSKKRIMQKEKETLDNADSNALYFNSTQFTITQPASPGAAQSHRKTRHMRHRLDLDNLEAPAESHKRKRKTAVDDQDSPGPHARHTADGQMGLYWSKGHELADADTLESTAIPVESLFASKELAQHHRMAVESVARRWATRRLKTPYTNGRAPAAAATTAPALPATIGAALDPEALPNGSGVDDASQEEGVASTALVAPAMDRTGSHATRSTRNNPVLNPLQFDPSDREADDRYRTFGLAALEAQRLRLASKDHEAPLTQGLAVEEQLDDLALFEEIVATGKY